MTPQPEKPSLPPLGNPRPYFVQTCGFGIDPSLCGETATWHVFWAGGDENSLTCDRHHPYVRSFDLYDEHPITAVCNMPDSYVTWSWEDAPGYCQWNVSDETMAAVERADRELVSS